MPTVQVLVPFDELKLFQYAQGIESKLSGTQSESTILLAVELGSIISEPLAVALKVENTELLRRLASFTHYELAQFARALVCHAQKWKDAGQCVEVEFPWSPTRNKRLKIGLTEEIICPSGPGGRRIYVLDLKLI